MFHVRGVIQTRQRASGVNQLVVAGLALLLAVGATITGAGTPTTVWADCARQAPEPGIRTHLGFALEGMVTSVEGRREPGEGWLYRVMVDVSEMLAGAPVDVVAFDLGTGDCWQLQGDRYKVGDRLIVTASAPPVDGTVDYLPDGLTWRYEWADHWTLHGLPEDLAATLSRPIREASRRDEILALVAPARLPYGVDPHAWLVTLARPRRDEHLIDAGPWGDGFVALGSRMVNRHRGSTERIVPTIWTSSTGEEWDEVAAPFGEVDDPGSSVARLLAFQGQLYAIGVDGWDLRIWRSDDGTAWDPVNVGRASAGLANAGLVSRRVVVGAAATDDRIVAITGPWSDAAGSDFVAWTSLDGQTWTRAVPTGLHGPIADLTPGPAGFLVRGCACSGPMASWWLRSSADGIAWERIHEVPALSAGIAFDEDADRYLAATLEVRENEDTIAALDASTDGTSWSRLTAAPGRDSTRVSVAASDATIVLLGSRYAPDDSGSFVMVSRDGGDTWTHSTVPGARLTECVSKPVVGASRVVLLGDCGPNLAWTSRE
jgi:hypothetical protein